MSGKNKHFNLKTNGKVYRNFAVDFLIKKSVHRKEGVLSKNGVLTVQTGKYTGRSPNDRFIVDDFYTHKLIHWGKVNIPLSEDSFQKLYNKIAAYFRRLPELFIFDGLAGADPKHRLKIRVYSELAYQNLFIQHMLLKPKPEELISFLPDFTILVAPSVKADPTKDKTNSEAFVVLNLSKKIAIIGGTQYAGEIKKSVFSVMNFFLPQKGVLPMHCSANIGKSDDTALFFGLSGTGKTTLSTDPSRKLIGDDEHGWSDEGVFNFEGGCYAKCINLSQKFEPYIYQAIRSGAICENVFLDPDTLEYDFTSSIYTENSRATYPLEFIPFSEISGRGGHPRTIIFLTADAFGVLPPVAHLSKNQILYHFLSGYTSKLAGTERGIKEPKAAFSTLFGEPFMPLNPLTYAKLLDLYVNKYKPDVYLINTGWSGGPYGTGKRISINLTREIVTQALNGTLKKAVFRHDRIFNLSVPQSIPKIPKEVLDQQQTWKNKKKYLKKAKELANLFRVNFQRFPDAAEEIKNSGPRG